MLNKSTFRTRQHQTGVTIVELMISIVLGLLLLSAATAMTVKSMVINGDTLTSAKLNQDLDAVLHVMVNDIRRAGYSGSVVPLLPREDLNVVSASCVLYAYDANANGALESTERFGFQLANGAVQMRTNCTGGACATSCAEGNWVNLTDNTTTFITDLTFDTQNSKCISITHPDNKAAANNNNYWVTSTSSVLDFPCLAPSGTASTNLTSYYLDANGVYQVGTFVEPDSGDRLVESRQVNVALAGYLGAQADTVDANTMVKSQKVAINVRNNHVYTMP